MSNDLDAIPARRTGTTGGVLTAVAAWAVPLLVLGGFALVAVVPVAGVVVGAFAVPALRRLRGWAVALGAAYALPLVLWMVDPHPAPSLTKDMHPLLAAVIVAVSVALLAVLHLGRRRQATAGLR